MLQPRSESSPSRAVAGSERAAEEREVVTVAIVARCRAGQIFFRAEHSSVAILHDDALVFPAGGAEDALALMTMSSFASTGDVVFMACPIAAPRGPAI